MNVFHTIRHHFATPWVLYLLLMIPLVGIMDYFLRRRQQHVLAQLGGKSALQALLLRGRWWRRLRALCFQLGVMALVVGTAGPRWGMDSQPSLAEGRDIVVVLDASRSMLAEDVLPSRLGKAKALLHQLVDALQRRGGHRLALVVFAGRPRIACPMTNDYDHFRDSLDLVHANDPLIMARSGSDSPSSGTRIGAALCEVIQLRDPNLRDHQDILLVSDGDDPVADDEWQTGVEAARFASMAVFTAGIGDPERDSPIPDANGHPLRMNGQPVETRLRPAVLQRIARSTGGKFLHVVPTSSDPAPLQSWFLEQLRDRPGQESAEDVLPVYQPRHAWFFAAALAMLVLSMLSHRTAKGGE